MENYNSMSSQLIITTELVLDHWLLTAELDPSSTLPPEIFVYKNNGTTTLGDFFGTCSLQDMYNTTIFSGVAIPTFGNKYVRYHQAKIRVLLEDDVNSVAIALLSNVKSLSKAYSSKVTTTEVYPIP